MQEEEEEDDDGGEFDTAVGCSHPLYQQLKGLHGWR